MVVVAAAVAVVLLLPLLQLADICCLLPSHSPPVNGIPFCTSFQFFTPLRGAFPTPQSPVPSPLSLHPARTLISEYFTCKEREKPKRQKADSLPCCDFHFWQCECVRVAITIAINIVATCPAVVHFNFDLSVFGRILLGNGIFNKARSGLRVPVSLATNQVLIAQSQPDRKCRIRRPQCYGALQC